MQKALSKALFRCVSRFFSSEALHYDFLASQSSSVKPGMLGWLLEVADILELFELKSAADVLAESFSHWRHLTRPPIVISGG